MLYVPSVRRKMERIIAHPDRYPQEWSARRERGPGCVIRQLGTHVICGGVSCTHNPSRTTESRACTRPFLRQDIRTTGYQSIFSGTSILAVIRIVATAGSNLLWGGEYKKWSAGAGVSARERDDECDMLLFVGCRCTRDQKQFKTLARRFAERAHLLQGIQQRTPLTPLPLAAPPRRHHSHHLLGVKKCRRGWLGLYLAPVLGSAEVMGSAEASALSAEVQGLADSLTAKAPGLANSLTAKVTDVEPDAARGAARGAAPVGGKGSSTGTSTEDGTPGAPGAPEEASGARTGGTSRSASW